MKRVMFTGSVYLVVPQKHPGRIPAFMRRRLLLLRSRFDYGETFCLNLRPGPKSLLLTLPEDIKHVLGKNASNYVKSRHLTSEKGRRRIGRGLLSSSGAEHHQKRRLLWPYFKPKAIFTNFQSVVQSSVMSLIQGWKPGTGIDLRQEMDRFSRSVIIAALFGADFQDVDHKLSQAISARRKFQEFYYTSRLPWKEKLPIPVVRDYHRAMQLIDATIYEQIEKRRSSSETPTDLVGMFSAATLPEGVKLSAEQLRDELMPLTTTGYETTADGLSWALHLISSHRAVEEQLLDEFNSAPDLADMPYTASVMSEVFRLYPPTWVFVRVPLDADMLPSGTRVSPEDTLMLCPYLMHRHPAYFSEPESFNPDRFTHQDSRTRWQYLFFPFGEGAHRCIGEHLVRLEFHLFLSMVLPRFRFELQRPERTRPRAGLTLAPYPGVPAIIHRR